MFARYLERLMNNRSTQAHMAMVRRDMELAKSGRRPLTIGFADYMA